MKYTIKYKDSIIATIEVATISTKYVTLKSTINIENYSYFLIKSPIEKRTSIITIFNGVNNLRDIIWNDYFNNKDYIDNKEILKQIDDFIQIISEEFGMKIIRED